MEACVGKSNNHINMPELHIDALLLVKVHWQGDSEIHEDNDLLFTQRQGIPERVL
jgi:hypothetical protein